MTPPINKNTITIKDHLILRTPSGISGDMLVTGLVKMADLNEREVEKHINRIGLPELNGSLNVNETLVDGLSGWRASVEVKSGHCHRTYRDILRIISESTLSNTAKQIASDAFGFLADAEGAVHGIVPKDVTFHEIGGLDSILDICLSASLFDALGVETLFSSPLPVCDGTIRCAHGLLASPSPAVLSLLVGIPVYGIDSEGETVTPTAVALLKALNTRFEKWPSVKIRKITRVYGQKTLPRIPNGAIFALGTPYENWASAGDEASVTPSH